MGDSEKLFMKRLTLLLTLAAISAGSTVYAWPAMPPSRTPEGGASVLLLGLGVSGLVAARRFFRK